MFYHHHHPIHFFITFISIRVFLLSLQSVVVVLVYEVGNKTHHKTIDTHTNKLQIMNLLTATTKAIFFLEINNRTADDYDDL